MTFEFGKDEFVSLSPSSVLLIVDPCKRNLVGSDAIPHAQCAGIIQNCRTALAHARAVKIPVAMMRDTSRPRSLLSDVDDNTWIKGFEPKRHDSMFDRAGPSCYGSVYFDEVVEDAGRHIVVAGFLGRGGCLATAADAVSMGHGITFLSNAIYDSLSERLFDLSMAGSLAAFTRFDIRIMQTGAWATGAKANHAIEGLMPRYAC